MAALGERNHQESPEYHWAFRLHIGLLMAPLEELWRNQLPDDGLPGAPWPRTGLSTVRTWYVDGDIQGVERFANYFRARQQGRKLRGQLASGSQPAWPVEWACSHITGGAMRWSGHDALLSFHVLVAAAALLIGPVAMRARKGRGLHTRTGEMYFWVVGAVCATGGALAIMEWEKLRLFFLEILSNVVDRSSA